VSQVVNYTVDNAAGNVVRADINTILEAIRTNNSGGSDPQNPIKFMLYGDSSDSILKVYDGSNFRNIGDVGQDNLGLLLKAGGTMTGALLADDSSGASTPAISFDGDPDTGIFRKGANTIGLSTAGTERAVIDNNGLTVQAQGDLRLADSDSSNWVALQAASAIGSNVTFTLPSADGSDGQMLKTNGSGTLSFTTVQGVPVGAVFCLAVSAVPSGYLECAGGAVSRTTYAALFAVIATNYGAGNGSSTFNLPDLRGEFVRGYDHGRGVDSGRAIASSQSGHNNAHNHTVTVATKNQSHYHNMPGDDQLSVFHNVGGWTASWDATASYDATSQASGGGKLWRTTTKDTNHNHTATCDNTGGNEARPRNVAMMYVIKY